MFQAWNILFVLAILWISEAICDDCLYQMEMWQSENPTEFYYCNPNTNQAEIGNCVDGKGFVKNATVTGCVPWQDWNNSCVNKDYLTNVTCEGDHFMQPHAGLDPQDFYLCTGPDSIAELLKCDAGRAFYAKDNYLGCFPWDMWRNLTGCA